jgi:predicted Zn-dependent protease
MIRSFLFHRVDRASERRIRPAAPRHSYRPGFEALEQRLLLYATTGSKWASADVSASFLPDGTTSEGYLSSLFAVLNPAGRSALPGNANLDDVVDIFDLNLVSANWGATGGAADTNHDGTVNIFDANLISAHSGETSTEIWQREFARALQTWANVSTLNFHFVSDSGADSGATGQTQGDSRFGDIRLGAHPVGSYLAYTYFPASGTLAGDITMNPNYSFRVGSTYDIYSLLLHEVGHSLGLNHSFAGTVMYATYTGIWTGLAADDIAGIQSLYGARAPDAFDSPAPNDSFADATSLSLGATGATTINADLTAMSDIDYYHVTLPAASDGTLAVAVDARDKSLLAPQLAVYDAAQNLVATARGTYGTVATISLAGLAPGQTYYLVADGATSDEFGMGAYRLAVDTGAGGGDPPGPTTPDQYEPNNALAAAAYLGKGNNISVAGLSIHDAADVDYFRFQVPNSASYQVSILFAHAAGNLDMAVYDAGQNLVASAASLSDNESLTLSLTANQSYYVKVFSPDGATNSYSLAIAKLGGGGGGGGLLSTRDVLRAEMRDGILPPSVADDAGFAGTVGQPVQRHCARDAVFTEIGAH